MQTSALCGDYPSPPDSLPHSLNPAKSLRNAPMKRAFITSLNASQIHPGLQQSHVSSLRTQYSLQTAIIGTQSVALSETKAAQQATLRVQN
jgi:hypothetical protein